MRRCRGCSALLVKRSQKLYCATRCQQAAQRQEKTRHWLATGEADVGSYQGHYIRDYLARAQEDRCAICMIGNEWCGAPLSFVLDHVNGESTDNRRENLRLICPNCDSQLPTYKSRNRGNGRYLRRARYARGQSY
ncbi:HNH endonuclease [Nocardia sp. NPDC019395]|uniref:HNH endonuclease n=1 Tax=Nocardia sp. NPDC019395 TaxID=3154686 RepID=UPI0033F4D77B